MSRVLYPRLQKKRLQQRTQPLGQLDRFKGKDFYCGDTTKLNQDTCCFNHIVGLPISEKTGLTNPLFDYQKMIFDTIFKETNDSKESHVWVKKATGLGITELILRVMLWLCTRNNDYQNSQMCIITGPGIDIATGLIERMKHIFENIGIYIENKETVLQVNGVMIKAFPSNHLSTYRGLTSPKFIFLDEGDFIKPNEIQEVRDTTERYITKSKPYIVMVSTPNKPDLLFQTIEQEPEDKTIYHRLFFNYQWGIDKMFTQDEIDLQRVSPGFDREYDLKYAGKIGNVFSIHDIDRAVALGEQLKDIPINIEVVHYGGIDPGYAKHTPIYIGELDKEHQCVRIVWHERYEKTGPKEIVKQVWELQRQFNNTIYWFVDAADAGLIHDLKIAFGENTNWKKAEDVSYMSNHILPVSFANHGHEHLLEHLYNLMSRGMVAIPNNCQELITSLKTAQATEWSLDKENTVYDDDLDCLRMLLKKVNVK